MSYDGLTSRQNIYIAECLETELTLLTNNGEWSSKIAWEIIYGIEASFISLVEIGKINLFTADELAKMIYKNITWQLDDNTHSPCILEDIPHYKCVKCDKIDNYTNEDHLCFDCEHAS